MDVAWDNNIAWYKVNLPGAGTYRIEVWYPAAAGYNAATPYIIDTTSGREKVLVDQRANGGRWFLLGAFTLAGGDHNVVGVSRWSQASGPVIADAIRITAT